MVRSSDIPWKRIFAEAAAIVASILLAFSIDAHWSDIQRDEHLRLVLNQLAVKFAENIALTSDNIDVANDGRERLQRFINFDPDDTDAIPPDGGFDLIFPISRPYTGISNNSVIISVLEREDLSPISGKLLIDAIDRWRAHVDQIQAKDFHLDVIELEALEELARHPQLATIYGNLFEGSDTILNDKDLINIRRDGRITALAVKKSVILGLYSRQLEALRKEAQDALAEILALQTTSRPDDAN